ncbi:MAG TPA: MBL fold metallo-hydrolase [Candidatus Paceibacterota bacterium]|nr:MBL fold metallo-hydrolase [Candidatus Paceibacterota bacterium]
MHESKLTFVGGAGSVTGSNFLLDTGAQKILVDCGLFQGEHSFDDANWQPFSFKPEEISVLINTHAHIDHIGRIPALVKQGYTGRIISTEATKALAEPMLLDAMELLRKTAQKIGKEPLYDEHDIAQAMKQWDTIAYHAPHELGDGMTLEFLNSGHILGSAMAKLTREGKTFLFTGDLGGGNSPLLSPCEAPGSPDYLLMESVYGDKTQNDHDRETRLHELAGHIESIAASGGTLLIPAFSTERTQDLVFDIRELMQRKRVPSMPVFLDSPLAQKITQSYMAYPDYFSTEMQVRIKAGERIFEFAELKYVHDAMQSRDVSLHSGAKIIIAGSGMSNGGRVVAHEAAVLPDKRSVVLIVGYQAAGSLGRQLAEGAKKVSIKGESVPVRARVETLYSYSAHMDSGQLLAFAESLGKAPEQIFVVMGEPASSAFLVQRIRDYAGFKAIAPEAGSTVSLAL